MSRIVVLGAGVAGHTAALHLQRKLHGQHEVIVVSPNSNWNWIPSNIWVGVGRMPREKVVFPLAPVYKRKGIAFHQGLATTLWPEGVEAGGRPAVDITYTSPERRAETGRIEYDYLINATGPLLNFAATSGLGPDHGYTTSVCTPDHAVDASEKLHVAIERLKEGEKLTFVIGMGNGTCTCEGAAFEYLFNVDHELREAGVRENATLYFFTNESELADFGVGGLQMVQDGYRIRGEVMAESLFRERDIIPILGAGAKTITENTIEYITVDGEEGSLSFDFAMLLPPFRGARLEAKDASGADISSRIFAPSGFQLVDADYAKKPYEKWRADDWPKTYQSPAYPNLFAAGIAFAPPHAISRPRAAPDGTVIAPSPPRTGQPSGAIAKAVALSIVDMVNGKSTTPTHTASMAYLAAACIASAGFGMTRGSAVSMVMSPIIPDFERFPETGRNLKETAGEIGLGGHWSKRALHTAFIYKMKGRPFWPLIPE